MAFPPVPVYPNAIDSDYTLFLVYNTTETRLCEDNHPWSEEIHIAPVEGDEIWADNGFGNIDGELFYYDEVDKNADGKVVTLKKCARQLQGTTKFTKKGEWVRSYVVAEHHNQIVNAILKVENFIGRNFDPRQFTLDWRIRNLQSLPLITDDFSCPDINFDFAIIETDNVTGIVARYDISSQQDGAITSFRLDFGDGEFTTTDLAGTHVYALNARIDPVVTVSNSRCQIVQTPNTRQNPIAPEVDDTPTFTIPIPPPPTVPDFTVIPINPAPVDIVQAPLVLPCAGLSDVSVNQDVNIPSQITIIGGFDLPSIIQVQSDIPTQIFVDIPPTITIDPPIPPTIVTNPSTSLTLDLASIPVLSIDWGTPPPMEFTLAGSEVLSAQSVPDEIIQELGPDYAELFVKNKVKVNNTGFPKEIKLLPPDTLPELKVNAPQKIMIEQIKPLPDSIPLTLEKDTITITGIPTEIPIKFPDKMPEIELVYKGSPIEFKISMDNVMPVDETGKYPCVMIVPCRT